MASLQRRHGAQVRNDIGQIGWLQSGIETVGHRLPERMSVTRNPLADGTDDFGIAPCTEAGGGIRGDVPLVLERCIARLVEAEK
jgi:hypothetical protein